MYTPLSETDYKFTYEEAFGQVWGSSGYSGWLSEPSEDSRALDWRLWKSSKRSEHTQRFWYQCLYVAQLAGHAGQSLFTFMHDRPRMHSSYFSWRPSLISLWRLLYLPSWLLRRPMKTSWQRGSWRSRRRCYPLCYLAWWLPHGPSVKSSLLSLSMLSTRPTKKLSSFWPASF